MNFFSLATYIVQIMQRHQTFSEIGLFFPRWHLVIAVTSYNENDNVDESVTSLI